MQTDIKSGTIPKLYKDRGITPNSRKNLFMGECRAAEEYLNASENQNER